MPNTRQNRRLYRATAASALVTATGLVAVWWMSPADSAPSSIARPAAATTPSQPYTTVVAGFEAPFPRSVMLPDVADRLANLEQLAADAPTGERWTAGTVSFENGFAQSQLVTIWRCSWEQALVNGTNAHDQTAVDSAAAMLARYYDLKSVQRYVVDPEHAWYRDVVEPALTGDTAAMTDDLNLNCEAPERH